jgi:transposase
MKFPVEQILNLSEMKVLDFQELEGEEIIITIEKRINYSTCPVDKILTAYIKIIGE